MAAEVTLTLVPPTLDDAMRDIAGEVDALLDVLLPVPEDARAPLYQAMRHAAIGGGKRLRPLLVKASAALFGVDPLAALRTGCAVEAIHVYSLIHDDLPCMDDDDLRRGKPTVHKQFDEGIAVLAGDSLHALAFEWLSDPATHLDPFVRCDLVAGLACAAGPAGMAGGQMMDIAAPGANFDLPAVTRLQAMKTGALIAFSVEAGAMLGRLAPEARGPLKNYARDVGLAFQIADDLIDATGDEATVGKAVGKDAAAGKATFLSLLGPERARQQADALVEQAISHLAGWGTEADLLRAIARYAVARDR